MIVLVNALKSEQLLSKINDLPDFTVIAANYQVAMGSTFS